MKIQPVIERIVKKNRIDEMSEALCSAMAKMPTNIKEELMHELEALAYTFTMDEAKQIVQRMAPYGEHWSLDKVKAYLHSQGIEAPDCIHYYVVMNMMYNDYFQTASAFGLKDNADFFYDLAKNFIEDVDGVDFKVEKYFNM